MNRKGFYPNRTISCNNINCFNSSSHSTKYNRYNDQKSKEASYQLLVKKNIVTSAKKTYYEECEYGDLSNRTKYGSYACQK